jgi:glycosyltransferase involved in cell wall biosynthesis
VVIVQEAVPAYRRPFFGRLRERLAESGIALVVAAGELREEDVPGPPDEPWLVRVPMSRGHAWARPTRLRLGGILERADLVVAEQALRHIQTYGLLVRQALGGTPVALWGHGRTIVKPVSALERWALQRMTNRAHWFFAYTEGGRGAVVHGGFPDYRVTVVQNATNTEELSAARCAVEDLEAAALRRDLDLPNRGVCLFVGTLVPAKRLDFLLAAAERIGARTTEFALVVAGDGPERDVVERAAKRNAWLRYVESVDTMQKARLASVSEVLLVPGRVGLVAVDSFATGTPIVTTRSPFHAPEFEYLVDGENAVVTDDDVAAYADDVESVLRNHESLEKLRRGCAVAARRYTQEAMVSNFTAGLLSALEAPRRRPRE